jgi:hypothetical protein
MMSYYGKDGWGRRKFLHGGSLALGSVAGAITALVADRLLSRAGRGKAPAGRALKAGPAPPWPDDFRPSTALSLRALQSQLRGGKRADLGGVTRIRGVAVEPDGEVLLVGDRDASLPPVDVDDLALALRSAYRVEAVYHQPPGCTIDPKEGAGDPWQIQVARILGMPETAAMGARFLAADYELKKVSVGVLSLGGSPDLFSLSRSAKPPCAGTAAQPETTNTVHRFWFCPSYGEPPRFLQDGSALWVRRPVAVQLLTEQEMLDRNARRVGGKEPEPLARQFAEGITAVLARADAPQYARMQGDFRTLEAGKLIRHLNASSDSLLYLLKEHRFASMSSPSYVGGIWREDQNEVVCDNPVTEERTVTGTILRSHAKLQRTRHRVIGGVEAAIEVSEQQAGPAGGQVTAMLERVRKARPAGDPVVWTV